VRENFSDSPIAFVVRYSELEERVDPRYYKPAYLSVISAIGRNSELKTLKEISVSINSGATPLAKGDAYVEKDGGIPFIRSGDLTEENIINYDDVLHIKKEIHDKALKRSRLRKNDVLIAIVGATIGKVSIFTDEREANINQAIACVRLNEEIGNPFYVLHFLRSKLGQVQLDRLKRPVARANINLEEVGQIKIPIPPRPIQDKLAEIMGEAYKQRKEKLKEAEYLLVGINDYVSDTLGIEIPEMEERKTFVVTLKELKEGKRHDVFYYQPKYTAASSALENSECETKPLKDITKLLSETRDPTKTPEKPFVYVEISDVDTKLGEITLYKELNGKEAPSRARMVIRKGDIVVSTTRPYRGAIAIVPDRLDDSIGSTGFAVLRPKEEINSLYLHTILRSKLCLAQLEQRMTGSNYPAITTGELKKIKIPVPPIEIQNEIAEEIKGRIELAKEMRKGAEEVIKLAKEKAEKMILGEEID
jgi:restriction endonuclease S subunit